MIKSIIVAALIAVTAVSFGQQNNDSEIEKLAEKIAKDSKYFGLIIGINQYLDDEIPDLNNPINDAEKLYQVLTTAYNFEEKNITLLRNATKADIIYSLDEIASVVTPDDHLLIFYAGHGDWDSNTNMGYWLPSGASRNYIDEWFSNSQVVSFLRKINSKHTLLIVDAGFGGSIFKKRSVFSDAPLDIEKLYELPSRKAMTSSSLNVVPDESVFTKFLIQRLIDNEEKILSSEQLFSSFRIAMMNESNTIPRYGTIGNTGDQGGDFIFLKSK